MHNLSQVPKNCFNPDVDYNFGHLCLWFVWPKHKLRNSHPSIGYAHATNPNSLFVISPFLSKISRF